MSFVIILCILLCGKTIVVGNTLDNAIAVNEVTTKSTGHSDADKVSRNGKETLQKIFESAVRAYLDEDWDGCIEEFEEALKGYKMYRHAVINCRRKCKAEATGSDPFFPENIDDLHFYQRKVTETLCLLKCNQDYREIAGAEALKRLPSEIEQKFVDRRPYEYLHICYYQKNRHQDAANAIFTFLVQHPNHEMSSKNLRYYLTLPDVDEEKILNLEEAPFLKMYAKGVQAYELEDYEEAVTFLESSLSSYMESEDDCRIYCEGPFDQGWFPEFTSSIANHFTYCLKCKRTCSQILNNVNGENRNDLLRSHYNYLQFAYYKLYNLKEACAAVESYLLFEPADETMWHNKKYYNTLPKVMEEYFKPREKALAYIKRQEYELMLLRYISQEFKIVEEMFQAFKEKNKQNTSKQMFDDPKSEIKKHKPLAKVNPERNYTFSA